MGSLYSTLNSQVDTCAIFIFLQEEKIARLLHKATLSQKLFLKNTELYPNLPSIDVVETQIESKDA